MGYIDYDLEVLKIKKNKINKKKGFKMQKCPTSALSPWLGHFCQELLHQCSVARRRSACGTAEVLAAWIFDSGVFDLPLDNSPKILFVVQVRRVS